MHNTKFIFLFTMPSLLMHSQWNTNLASNTPICVAAKNQDNSHTVTDAKGGAIMCWDDNRNSITTKKDIYAQRITKDGLIKWTANGIAVCSNTATQSSSSIIDAGNGSAIITWEDTRAGNYDIYAQKIDSSGNILWALDGIVLCSKTTNQKNPKIVSDNAGGAIIVWEDSVSFYWDIYAQKISASGASVWATGGVPICIAANTQINPRLESDGAAGAIITWQDKRNNTDYDIYAQRILSAGSVAWAANGVGVCNVANTQSNPRIEPDGTGGVIIGWVDKRSGTDNNIYAQRYNATGVAQWAANGIVVCNAANNQSALDMKYIGTTGFVITWKDERLGSIAIYAQFVSLTGVIQLAPNGMLLSNSIKSLSPNVVSDGNGGAIIAWQDSVGVEWNIKAQKLNSAGFVQWAPNGITISNAADDQISVSQISDSNGGAIFVWQDHRNGTNDDIYAHRIFANGITASINERNDESFAKSICFPNPINSTSVIKIENKLNEPWLITIFNSYGSILETSEIEAGSVYFLNGKNYESGIYFYKIKMGGNTGYSKGNFISAE